MSSEQSYSADIDISFKSPFIFSINICFIEDINYSKSNHSCLAFVCFIFGYYIAGIVGALLLTASYNFDDYDGEIART
jgi:hypothetical protein